MTGFDFAVLGVLALSTLLAYVRGVVRELMAIVSWVIGFFAALAFGSPVAAALPGMEESPVAKYVVAFALVFIVVLVLGAIVAHLLSKVVRAAGLGFLDRFLGALFGLARGVLLVLVLVLIAGLTELPRNNWWQNSLLAPSAVALALALRDWLPSAWAAQLDFSANGRKLGKSLIQARSTGNGVHERCAESLA